MIHYIFTDESKFPQNNYFTVAALVVEQAAYDRGRLARGLIDFADRFNIEYPKGFHAVELNRANHPEIVSELVKKTDEFFPDYRVYILKYPCRSKLIPADDLLKANYELVRQIIIDRFFPRIFNEFRVCYAVRDDASMDVDLIRTNLIVSISKNFYNLPPEQVKSALPLQIRIKTSLSRDEDGLIFPDFFAYLYGKNKLPEKNENKIKAWYTNKVELDFQYEKSRIVIEYLDGNMLKEKIIKERPWVEAIQNVLSFYPVLFNMTADKIIKKSNLPYKVLDQYKKLLKNVTHKDIDALTDAIEYYVRKIRNYTYADRFLKWCRNNLKMTARQKLRQLDLHVQIHNHQGQVKPALSALEKYKKVYDALPRKTLQDRLNYFQSINHTCVALANAFEFERSNTLLNENGRELETLFKRIETKREPAIGKFYGTYAQNLCFLARTYKDREEQLSTLKRAEEYFARAREMFEDEYDLEKQDVYRLYWLLENDIVKGSMENRNKIEEILAEKTGTRSQVEMAKRLLRENRPFLLSFFLKQAFFYKETRLNVVSLSKMIPEKDTSTKEWPWPMIYRYIALLSTKNKDKKNFLNKSIEILQKEGSLTLKVLKAFIEMDLVMLKDRDNVPDEARRLANEVKGLQIHSGAREYITCFFKTLSEIPPREAETYYRQNIFYLPFQYC